MMAYPAAHVRTAYCESGAALVLNLHNDEVICLLPEDAQVWGALLQGEVVPAELPKMVELTELGFLQSDAEPRPQPPAKAVRPTRAPSRSLIEEVHDWPKLHYAVLAVPALLVGVLASYLRADRLERLLRRVKRRPCSPEQAERLVRAVRWAARFTPWRSACLEVSIAVILAGLATGHTPDWRRGATFYPVAIHAWVEVGGIPVLEPDMERAAFAVLASA